MQSRRRKITTTARDASMLMQALARLGREPPFRILTRAILKRCNVSVRTRAIWELSRRPAYMLGLVQAAEQARKQGVKEISVMEFGVAGGNGLVALQNDAAAVERELGVRIRVYGFDAGPGGLPEFCGDHRDHPDVWQPGDYPMDVEALRARLAERTTLVLGAVRETVPAFFQKYHAPPIGFVSFDLDLYSSTRDALRIFTCSGSRMLWHVPVYFDDIEFVFNSHWAGEFLALDEFNHRNEHIKIDRWYGLRNGRPFPERGYFDQMFVAHDLLAISGVVTGRDKAHLRLTG